ncbi:MAG: DUF732 domain-containing protein [Mycobacterium sp.]|uniref:DUF732 domain-containing protein n=1 Tax=Mycobacterium sp. TaxID=1785 RepID=UPI003CC6C5CB
MRRFVFAATTTAVIGLAVAPQAAADKTDEAFLASLRQAKISYGDATQAVAAGKKVCDMAKNGKNASDVVQAVKTDNPGFSDDGATRFAAIAANWYCPDQLGVQ